MSLPTSDEEWASRISQIKGSLPTPIPLTSRPVPELTALARTIDHTQLSLSATPFQIDTLCSEAREFNFATVCVRASYVSRAVKNLEGSPIGVACVVGFHEGTYPTDKKAVEAEEASKNGATELDMVMNYVQLKEGQYTAVFNDVQAVRNAAKDVTLKVILETSQLSRDQVIAASVVSCLAGADYVKTSTGFNGPGARVEDVALMRAVCDLVSKEVKVKASGGVRTAGDCIKMIQAGADRIGASAGVKIVNDEQTTDSSAPDLLLKIYRFLLQRWSFQYHAHVTVGQAFDAAEPRAAFRFEGFNPFKDETVFVWSIMHDSKKRKISHEANSREHEDSPDTSKPTAVFTPQCGRFHTLSVALPGSIIANAKSHDQKTFLAGSIARALAVFCVDEIVIFEDEPRPQPIGNGQPHEMEYTAFTDPCHFLTHVLSYLETPPHLRRDLFPMHPNLRTAGTLPSLDMPHHIRANEWCEYREAVTIQGENYGVEENASEKTVKKKSKKLSKAQREQGAFSQDGLSKDEITLAKTGLPEPVRLLDLSIPPHTRLTLKFKSQDPADGADPVDPATPREEAGYYWGYSIRRCSSLSSVFTECPFDGGYDLSFGTSERGVPLVDILQNPEEIPQYKHLLLVFGGVAGLEVAAKVDSELVEKGIKPGDVGGLFDYWVNILPGQGSRTIRTEEAVWLGLMGLREVAVTKGRD
ncbi:hypothetical protein LOZ53_001642 [Ophidiomyces ophidiicola]|nr:hypothetical protein LOZ55_000986 [Ophidiomyces ophidiicola]KAI1983253.1 hypothetical protein LOZ54_005018 [Ophidiomyces ophidiicola]KAI1990434.1 hypothetical protein LOZ51_004785 [Ophidiomyces ophidiicola]KAI1994875.1 hypothetical protein LOZ53_001642 [Ophidiomyces ophidiicola]